MKVIKDPMCVNCNFICDKSNVWGYCTWHKIHVNLDSLCRDYEESSI